MSEETDYGCQFFQKLGSAPRETGPLGQVCSREIEMIGSPKVGGKEQNKR